MLFFGVFGQKTGRAGQIILKLSTMRNQVFERKNLENENFMAVALHAQTGFRRSDQSQSSTPSQTINGGPVPVLESPPGACQPKFKVAWSEHIFRQGNTCFKLVGLMAFPLEIRQLIWQVLLPILDIMSLRRNYQGVKMWMFLILELAKLLGACKPGSRAHMDSRTGPHAIPIP